MLATWHCWYLVAWHWTWRFLKLLDIEVLLDVLQFSWSWYLKFWNPAVFSKPTNQLWSKCNCEAMHYMLSLTCTLCVWHNNHLWQQCGSHCSACFWLCNAVVNTFISQIYHIIFLKIKQWPWDKSCVLTLELHIFFCKAS